MRNKDSGRSRVPRVSIGMPVFNDAAYLPQALESLLSQSFTDFELIISDDASSDGSELICRDFERRDPRLRYIRHQVNRGISANMEFVLREARGEYFLWAADDDLWDRRFLEALVRALDSHEAAACAFCGYSFIVEPGEPMPIRRIRVIDYSSRFRVVRLLKLCLYYDDGFGYGMFRRKSIERVSYPRWWWVNSRSALNIIFPVLFYFLSAGDFVLGSSTPLWFNRLKRTSAHFTPYRNNKVLYYLAFVLRKINVFFESAMDIYRGSGSVLLTLAVVPGLLGRLAFDCFQTLAGGLPFSRSRR